MIHAGILLVALMLVLSTSCQKEEPPPEPDPVADFFKDLQKGLDNALAESVTVIAVEDSIGAGDDLRRQVYQEILSRLYDLDVVAIIEYPSSRFQAAFSRLAIVPRDGIAPEDVIELAKEFTADALLYASIESSAPDVHFKLYSAATGAVVFAETLQNWKLSVSRTEGLTDLLGDEAAGLGGAESSGSL
jgi:hypothetical protein